MRNLIEKLATYIYHTNFIPYIIFSLLEAIRNIPIKSNQNKNNYSCQQQTSKFSSENVLHFYFKCNFLNIAFYKCLFT